MTIHEVASNNHDHKALMFGNFTLQVADGWQSPKRIGDVIRLTAAELAASTYTLGDLASGRVVLVHE